MEQGLGRRTRRRIQDQELMKREKLGEASRIKDQERRTRIKGLGLLKI